MGGDVHPCLLPLGQQEQRQKVRPGLAKLSFQALALYPLPLGKKWLGLGNTHPQNMKMVLEVAS